MLNQTRIDELKAMSMFALAAMAKSMGIVGIEELHKQTLVLKIAYRETSNRRDASRTVQPFEMAL